MFDPLFEIFQKLTKWSTRGNLFKVLLLVLLYAIPLSALASYVFEIAKGFIVLSNAESKDMLNDISVIVPALTFSFSFIAIFILIAILGYRDYLKRNKINELEKFKRKIDEQRGKHE